MGDVDEVLCAGDTIYEYRFSNETIALIRESGIRMVLGNHEATFLGPQGERARSSPSVDQQLVRYLQDLPMTMRTTVNGKSLYMVHASPWEPYNEYLYSTSAKLSRLPELGADIVILGHTHETMVRRIGRTLVINPGSVGEARGFNDLNLTYAVLDTVSEEVEIGTFRDPSR